MIQKQAGLLDDYIRLPLKFCKKEDIFRGNKKIVELLQAPKANGKPED